MDNDYFKTCSLSWDGEEQVSEELEAASLFLDIILRKNGDKRLPFFKNTPERISFISKLYFPLKVSHQGDLSFVLGTSFFYRNIKDYKLDRNKIESSISEILKDGVTAENLKRFNELLGEKGPFGKITGRERGNYVEFQVRGGYPDRYPGSFMGEFKFVRNIRTLQRDGVVLQQDISDHALEKSTVRLKLKMSEIESDINCIKEKKTIISNIVNMLHEQRDDIDRHYRQLHARAVRDCNSQDADASICAAAAISAIDREFESNIKMFTKYYPLLHQGLVNPTEFGGWEGLSIGTYPYQKSDRKYQAIAAGLLSKVRTCKSIVNRLKPEQALPTPQMENFINQVYEMTDNTEKQVYRQLDYVNSAIKEIWAKEEAVKNRWNSAIKQIEGKIEVLSKEQEGILKRLDLILASKKSTVEEIKANIALSVNSLPDTIYVPFWVACLSKQDETRLLVYGPMKKRMEKGFVDALRGYAMPLEPYSDGTEKLRSEIERRLKDDKKLAERVIAEGKKYNKLNSQFIESANRGLETLRNEGWIRDKGINDIAENICGLRAVQN